MASGIRYAVSATPVITLTKDANDDTGVAVDSFESTVGKSLAGGGAIAVSNWGTSAYHAYDESDNLLDEGTPGPVADTGDALVEVSGSSVGAIFIRHSGFDVDYAATTALVTVKTGLAGTTIGVLGAGEALVLPRCTLQPSINCASGTVRIEYAVMGGT